MAKKIKKTKYKKLAWKEFSRYRRLMYADEGGIVECCTCGEKLHWKKAHAGHYVDSRNNSVLLDERLVYPQCPTCNIYRHGNKNQYTFFMLDKKFTLKQLKEFEALKKKVKKVSEAEWKELYEMYREKANYIQQEKEL